MDRLRKYEMLLSENNIKFESIAADLPGGSAGGIGEGPGGEDVAELGDDLEGLRTSPGSSTTPSVGSGRRSQSEK